MKSIFPASLLAACLLLEMNVAGQAPDSGPPQTTPPPKVQNRTTRTIPNVPDDSSNGFSIGAIYWLSQGPSDLSAGHQSTNPAVQNLILPDFNKKTYGVRLTTPAGKYNRLEISGFQALTSGDSKAAIDLNFFGNPFPAGDTLHSSLRVRNVKISWNYLMYPAPPTSKLRFKALFEFQYLGTKTSISAPLDKNVAPVSGTRNIYLPTLGLGADFVPSSHFRIELKGSGMGFPDHSYLGDAEADLVFHAWHVDFVGGGRYYTFRTSPNSDQFVHGTLFGPFVSVRFLLGK